MDHKPSELEDYQGKEFEDKAYKYLRTKWEHDPEDLSEIEGGLLLLFNTCRYLTLKERGRKYIEEIRKGYEKGKALLTNYKADTYQGEDVTADFRKILPVDADQIAKKLGDLDLVVDICQLEHELVEAVLEREPLLPTRTMFTPEEHAMIEEERQNLIAAGYPEEHLEAMATKRGTFKAFFRDKSPLPPIDLDDRV